MRTIADQILTRVRDRGHGSVFVPKDFLDLGGRAVVDQTLSRLVRRGTLRRVGRGLYDYPRVSPRLGVLSPRPESVAAAVARRTDSVLQPSGAQAANSLGLSTQVPARLVYLTDGPTRRVQVGAQAITFRHAAPRHLAGAGTAAGSVLQALRHLGRDHVDSRVIQTLARQLRPKDKRALRQAAVHATDWLRAAADQIAPPPARRRA